MVDVDGEVQHLEGGILGLGFLGGKEPGSMVYLKLWQHHDYDKLANPRVCVVDDQQWDHLGSRQG
jgi:hypothetical protein